MPVDKRVAGMAAHHGRRKFLRVAGGATLAVPWFWTRAAREYAEYDYIDGAITRTLLDISPTGETEAQRTATAEAADHWYRDITGEMFG